MLLEGFEGHRDVGVVLTPIITKDTIALDELRGRTLAVDGNGELYQFLALIRLRDGTPLRDSKGRTTSHLSGLFYRSTRLMADHGVRLHSCSTASRCRSRHGRSRSAAPDGSATKRSVRPRSLVATSPPLTRRRR